jgi:hypothetical protein
MATTGVAADWLAAFKAVDVVSASLRCDQRSAVLVFVTGIRAQKASDGKNNMMLRLSHNRVIVLDRRSANLTLLSTGSAGSISNRN